MNNNWTAWNIWLLAACIFCGLEWWVPTGVAFCVAALHMWGHTQ